MTAKRPATFSEARPIAKNLEWLAVRGSVEIFYNPKKEWFTVKTGDGTTVSNIDLREALDVARDLFEEK